MGDPCGYVEPIAPAVHTEGTKRYNKKTQTWFDATLRWDDRLKLWVDTMPVSATDPSPAPGIVFLVHGAIVRDGDPRVHYPSLRWNETDGVEQEGMVH